MTCYYRYWDTGLTLLCAALKSPRILVSTVYLIFQTGCFEHLYLLNVTMISIQLDIIAWKFSYCICKKSGPFLYYEHTLFKCPAFLYTQYSVILLLFPNIYIIQNSLIVQIYLNSSSNSSKQNVYDILLH